MLLAWDGRGGLALGPLLVLLALVPVWLVIANTVALYHLPERRVDHTLAEELGPIFLTTTVWSWIYLVVGTAVLPGPIEVLGPVVLWAAAIVAIVTTRAVARRIARHRTWFRRHVVLIGDGEGTDRVLRRVLRHPEWGLDVASRIRLVGDRLELATFDGPLIVRSEMIESPNGDGLAGRIASAVGDMQVDRAILAGFSSNSRERARLVRLLTEGGHTVDFVYGEPETPYATAVLHNLEGLPVLSVQPTELSRGSAAMKRGLDVVISLVGLVLLGPILGIAAIGIKLGSSGSILFRQPRIGRGGDRFEMIKLRTMVEGADAMRDDVKELSLYGNGDGLLKVSDDPRITRLGSILRRWSIDELPQLWNVLRGDMSLVGPRPLPLDEACLVEGHFEMRSRVRPGITGTWQTQGRSDIPFEDMVKLDYTYVAGWSLREDLRVLLRTVGTVARGQGAY
jgi:exopolysaccharide biosynthesis polyprenyl glycosylphosphotransferase